MTRVNTYGQAVGDALPNWHPRSLPEKTTLKGKSCRLEPLELEKHGKQLYEAYSKAEDDRMWTYVPLGPFQDYAEYAKVAAAFSNSTTAPHYAVVNNATDRAVGSIALINCDPNNGSVEVGYVLFSPELQRTVISSEAVYLLIKYALETLRYRRCEWKCDSLNEASGRAAQRFGFKFEGTFRNAAVYKGRTRDTRWYSITDYEWPLVFRAFNEWLSDANHLNGQQKERLADIRSKIENETAT
ncbi:LAFA_0D07954g1_1 [Lachancea sp. 'fantastica']|nr:LAFA_0D07954g1_1 [Lachancea sp. 'fantastica']